VHPVVVALEQGAGVFGILFAVLAPLLAYSGFRRRGGYPEAKRVWLYRGISYECAALAGIVCGIRVLVSDSNLQDVFVLVASACVVLSWRILFVATRLEPRNRGP
jgi:hypothetical protein